MSFDLFKASAAAPKINNNLEKDVFSQSPDDSLKKREQFAISLRKKKTKKVI